ncbi:MAG: ribosome biogenesis GTP-binding protein YihA/YsxC [Oscillibacter sp.]
MALNFGKVDFIRSAVSRETFLRDGMPQFAFAGRSNVGKSSVINRVLGRKNIAYVGATPGKTSQVNYFQIDNRAYLVDLPGYGYAKVAKTEKERWGKLMESYFEDGGDLITLGVLIVDIRHKPSEDDLIMHNWFRESNCPEIVLANKLDKLKAREVEPALALIRETLALHEDDVLIPFSAEKGSGRDLLLRQLNDAFEKKGK